MIETYLLKLLVVLPVMAGLLVAGLLGWRKLQARLPGAQVQRRIAVSESMMLSPGLRLAVVRFDDRDLLVSVGKGGVSLVAEGRGA